MNLERRAGLLILVVGPSGVGKDSLMRAASTALPPARFVFARREITRAADDDGEDFRSVSEPEFAERAARGEYMLSWRAHGFGYGIPSAYEDDLRAGRAVVANASRTVLDEARRLRPAAVRVVLVTAPPEILEERLRARGREDEAALRERLERAALPCDGSDVIAFANDRPLDDSAVAFARLLETLQHNATAVT